MNTLSNVEAERVSHILRSTIERVGLMKCVPQKKDDALLDAVPAPKVTKQGKDEVVVVYVRPVWLKMALCRCMQRYCSNGIWRSSSNR